MPAGSRRSRQRRSQPCDTRGGNGEIVCERGCVGAKNTLTPTGFGLRSRQGAGGATGFSRPGKPLGARAGSAGFQPALFSLLGFAPSSRLSPLRALTCVASRGQECEPLAGWKPALPATALPAMRYPGRNGEIVCERGCVGAKNTLTPTGFNLRSQQGSGGQRVSLGRENPRTHEPGARAGSAGFQPALFSLLGFAPSSRLLPLQLLPRVAIRRQECEPLAGWKPALPAMRYRRCDP